jgi:hypothetical protein
VPQLASNSGWGAVYLLNNVRDMNDKATVI